jgi:hypothetical protein
MYSIPGNELPLSHSSASLPAIIAKAGGGEETHLDRVPSERATGTTAGRLLGAEMLALRIILALQVKKEIVETSCSTSPEATQALPPEKSLGSEALTG